MLLLPIAGIFLFFYLLIIRRYLSKFGAEEFHKYGLRMALAVFALYAFSRVIDAYQCKYKYSWYDRADAVSFCPGESRSGLLKTPIGEGFGEFGISRVKGKGNIEGRVDGRRVVCLGKSQTQKYFGYDKKQGRCLLLD